MTVSCLNLLNFSVLAFLMMMGRDMRTLMMTMMTGARMLTLQWMMNSSSLLGYSATHSAGTFKCKNPSQNLHYTMSMAGKMLDK